MAKIADNKACFRYDGPFLHFGTVQGYGEFYTYAVSFEQARNNILYQYKMQNGYKPTFKLDLDMSKLGLVEE
jgi:hypothetical protein